MHAEIIPPVGQPTNNLDLQHPPSIIPGYSPDKRRYDRHTSQNADSVNLSCHGHAKS